MAPWSSRLLASNPRPHESSSSPIPPARPAPESPSKNRGRARLTEADILDNAYGIPTLPPPPPRPGAAATKARAASAHGRSMSHPFPSLFHSKKKPNNEPGGASSGVQYADNDDMLIPESSRNAPPNMQSTNRKVPDKDLLTGKCMTCNSSVRWPKDLSVFKCTVCLTVNDLQPVNLRPKTGGVSGMFGGGKATTFPGGRGPQNQRVAPLSVDKTRRIAERCVTTYLLDRMRHDEVDCSNPEPSTISSPPASRNSVAVPESFRPPTGTSTERSSPQNIPMRPPVRSRGSNSGDRPVLDVPRKISEPRLTPYSTSSPGSFLGSHMESRNQANDSSWDPNAAGRPRGTSSSNAPGSLPESVPRKGDAVARNLFRPLEEYIIASFSQFDCVNSSFSTARTNPIPRTASEGTKRMTNGPSPSSASQPRDDDSQIDTTLPELDPRMLMLGDFAENGSWWTGKRDKEDLQSPEKVRPQLTREPSQVNFACDLTTVKSPRIDWPELNEWYHVVTNPGKMWRRKLDELTGRSKDKRSQFTEADLAEIEETIFEAQMFIQRILLKATEGLLKRPGRPLQEPDNLRFLLIILANPLLYPSNSVQARKPRSTSGSVADRRPETSGAGEPLPSRRGPSPAAKVPPTVVKGSSGQHSGIIKRIVGLLSNAPNECHHCLVSWFARYPEGHFQRTTELVGSFVTYRLTRQHGKRRETDNEDPTAGGLIPSMNSGGNSSAALHAALGHNVKKPDPKPKAVVYSDDWQIKASARVMALLFSANNSGLHRKNRLMSHAQSPSNNFQSWRNLEANKGTAIRAHAAHGQILPTSHFYNTLLDYSDLIADFEAWERKASKFAFCQYPFFLSIWAKIQIMEHDARRQMEVKAREAFFDSIMTRKNVNQYLILKVRRECLVEDSLKGVSEVVGTGGEEVKKGLRIEFKGEEGIDAGGLRKEWFLLLVRDVFNPEHGMFTYDDDSRFCYFNPNSFETTDQYFLVGVVLGLAIYNSTILDVALPPFAFRKLLAAAPTAAPGAASHAKPSMTYSLEDLAEYRPALAHGLKQLLEYDGDVESTFCRDFVADVDRYGQQIQVPLCYGGENKPVTNDNRREFVDLYVRYLLDTAVARQFEPFKRGFFTVCGGNALSLFRPEEIELLIRGSDEALDIASLRAVSICENWGVPNPADSEPVIRWFWESFEKADPKDQRKLLSFITGSSCIPAMGATSLVIKLSCLGDGGERFPVARTCFNMISLWRYETREKLEEKLWRAVHESEGFGLK